MPFLEPQDVVTLKSDPSLLAIVERTRAVPDGFHGQSIEELLIVNYTDVSQDSLLEFTTTGIPPEGYVFVICIDEQKGAFLAREDGFDLVSRSFDLGDVVKRIGQSSSMTGTVVSISESYILEQIFFEGTDGRIRSRLDPTVTKDKYPYCDACKGEIERNMIYNVSAEDIKQESTVFEGDLVLRDDWVGATSESDDVDIVLLVNDGIAVVRNPDLQMPIHTPTKPLVSIPEFDQLARPAVLNATQGWDTVPITLRTPHIGSLVVTSKNTLKKARWIRGQSDQPQNGNARAQEGIVIAVVPRTIVVRWITPSPFTRKTVQDMSRPPSARQACFKNINTFSVSKDLKPKDGLRILEPSMCGSPSARSNLAAGYQDLRAGDQVRFKDPYGAAVKYGGSGACKHNAFNRVNSDYLCPGWDVNCLNVVSKTQRVTVQWQDGKHTTDLANEFYRFTAFESALVPGNIVVNRTGLQMGHAGPKFASSDPDIATPRIEFNEMAFFESPHNLFVSKVGIVQAVDHEERIARVRWFLDPKVVLTDGGELLSPYSLFGSMGNTIDEVSLYEIMTFPAFDWRIRDYVIVPPTTTLDRLQKALSNKDINESYDVSQAEDPSLDLDRLLTRAQVCLNNTEVTRRAVCVGKVDDGDRAWIGEVLAIGLDGQLSVRMRGIANCRDTILPLDVILATINTDVLNGQDLEDDGAGLEEWWEDYVSGGEDYYSRSPSPISESIEYEGGERMDDDDDEEAWVSAEDDAESSSAPDAAIDRVHEDADEDVEMTDASTQTPLTQVQLSDSGGWHSIGVPSEAPASFDILSIPPPLDQWSVNLQPNTSPAFLRRIGKEHKTLASSLPEGQIYVRTYESRLDLLRCLIIGPPDTPYEDAPFLVDLYLGPDFPAEPPVAHFHSWTSGLGRINPNLYEEGKICLSLLGTWPGKESQEGWSADATILQVLVSLQGLVMVRNPFFNEAGFEGYEAEGGYKVEAAQYAEKAYCMARSFVKHALTRPPVGTEDALGWLYAPQSSTDRIGTSGRDLLKRVILRGQKLVQRSEEVRSETSKEQNELRLMDGAGGEADPTKNFLRPLSKGAMVMLQRTLAELEAMINRE